MPILNSIHKKLLFLIVIIAFIFISAWIFIKQQSVQKESSPTPISISTLQSPSILSTTTAQETKTYRNEQWGFELQYPQNLIIKEGTFGSYYSKFNLEIFTQIREQFDSTFLVNIVFPEFAEHSFRGIEKTTSEITVAGVRGIKYQYKYQGFLHTAVILPFGELRIILATGDGSRQYLDEFNQILASFKFLK